jgi:hypothetical protein
VKAYLLFTERRWEDCGRLPVYDLTNVVIPSVYSGILSTPSGGPRFVFKRARGGPRQESFKIPSRFKNLSNYKTFTSPLRFKPYDLHPPLRGLIYTDP